MTPKKTKKTTTIEVSVETYERLHRAKDKLKAILHRPVSFETLFKIFFVCEPLDKILQDLMLEETNEPRVRARPSAPS